MVVTHETEETARRSFDGVKVFSATMAEQRHRLGDVVTAWIGAHPDLTIVDVVQAQSSDSSFHCISISVFYKERGAEQSTAFGPELGGAAPTGRQHRGAMTR